MTWVDAILSPNYAIKSAIKLIIFLMLPLGYSLIDRDVSLGRIFIFHRKSVLFSVLLGIGVYLFIIGAYFIIGPYFDFTNITITLENNIGVNKNNFIFVALYISFINSLLEEFFFRGFAFLTLKRTTSRRVAYLFSASAFSFYHIAIMTSWFTPLLFILLIISLFLAGLLFNWLNEKSGTIYTSWLVHMCANFAINTIGFMLFGIL
ncbi:CPBP family intramembrane glutamic endopeptidase [Alkaliphilus metalliredigens]|nr:CPBP family intramembrane glutamic endopeptidase [Alkaliphilus metalliredigens]